MQQVILTFSDGKQAVFNGPVACHPGETRTIKSVHFTHPRDLPPGYKFEVLNRGV